MPFPGTVQSGGNKIDTTKLQPFTNINTGTVLATSYAPILSINGKGFLRSALVFGNTGLAAFGFIRITIDGIVKFDSGTLTANAVSSTGVLSFDDIFQNSATSLGIINPAGIASTPIALTVPPVSYPYTVGTSGVAGAAMLGAPIYFYSSLLIEAKSSVAATSHLFYYTGGFQ